MRWRLLRRRLTISAPRMAVRSALPWPLRWLAVGLMLGLSAAVALWAFEFGKEFAGLERDAQRQLQALRGEVLQLRQTSADALARASSADTTIATERAAQAALSEQLKQLEAENARLRSDLKLFETLIPGSAKDPLTVRGLQAERIGASQLKWQVLLMQPARNAPEFAGQIEVGLTGSITGKPWAWEPAASQPVALRQYLRVEGVLDLPADAVVKTLTVKLRQGGTTKTAAAIRLP